MEIDLNAVVPQPLAEPTIDILQAQSKEQLSPEDQAERGRRYLESAKELLNENEDTIKTRIQNGDEEGLRLDIASALEARELTRRERAIGEVARTKGRSLSTAEYNAIVKAPIAYDPLTAPESDYAKHMLKTLDDNESAISAAVMEADPTAQAEAQRVLDIGHSFTTNVATLRKWTEKVNSVAGEQSWTGFIADQGKMLIPGYQDYYGRGQVKGTGMFDELSRSASFREQRKALFRLPPDQFNAELTRILEPWLASNPSMAKDFVAAMSGHSSYQDVLADVGLAADYFGLPGAATVGKALNKYLGKAVADVATATAVHGADKVAVQAAAGAVDRAAISKAAEQITRNAKGAEFTKSTDTLDKLPSMFRADQKDFLANPPARAAEHLVDRVVDMYNKASDGLTKAINDKVLISRTPILQATEEVLTENIAKSMIARHVSIADQMFDISKPILDQATTTLSVDLKFGDSTGRLFTSPKIADRFIKEHGLLGAKVEQQGMRWYVKLNQPIVETDNWVKDLVAKTTITENPDSILNAFLGGRVGKLRNPDDILTDYNRLQRKLANTGGNNLLQAAVDVAKSFKDLQKGVVERGADGKVVKRMFRLSKENRARWDQFNRTITMNRKMDNPLDPEGPKGYMFKDMSELDNFYMQQFGRVPDPAEVEAYFAFKAITEMDRVANSLLLARDMLREGVEKHRIYVRNTGDGTVYTNSFHGAKRDHLPGIEDTVALIGRTTDDIIVKTGEDLKSNSKFWKALQDDIATGRKIVIQLWNSKETPFDNIPALANNMPKWVVLDKVDTTPIDIQRLIPRRHGGHYEYDYSHYVKQANVIREHVGGRIIDRYLGDTTIMPVAIRKLGQDAAKILDDIRIALKNKDEAGAKKIFDDFAPVGLPWNEVRGWFRPTKVPGGGTKRAMLNLKEPIVVIGKDEKIANLDKNAISSRYMDKVKGYSTFRDDTVSGDLATKTQRPYTDQRDARELMTLNNEGTRSNPLYKYEPAKFVDPLLSMDKAYTKITRSAYMDDYKIQSIESWIEQALPILNAEERQVRQAPFHYFHNAEEYYSRGADPIKRANMEVARQQISQFLGVRDWTDNILHASAQRLADTLYSKNIPLPIDPAWLLPKLKDPLRFMRGMAFHLKLGMFAVPQFMVQSQSWVTIAAIGGGRAAATAIPAAGFSRMAMLNSNEAVLKHMDNLMTKVRMPGVHWKPGEWMDSHEAMRRSGWNIVAGEAAVRDDHLSPRLIRSAYANFLDAGTVFFTEGERAARMGAWHVAYKEFRKHTPHGKLSDTDIQKILARADDMTVNMTRASSSMLHQGIMSIPTQFLSYQIRLAELMWGKRLTPRERGRILLYQSMAYGVPIIPGVAGIPIVDSIKQSALENGYVVGDGWINSMFMEGMPAAFLAMATGNGDPNQGTWFNIQDRYGPQGFETLYDMYKQDKSMMEILGGPALSTAQGIYNATIDPLTEMMFSAIRGDQKMIKITPNHLVDAMKEISSFNQAYKTIAAINTGRWLSKQDQYLADTSAGAALFMGITGLQPQSVTDAMLKSWSVRDKKKFEAEIEKRYIREFRKGLEAVEKNPGGAQVFFDNAATLLSVHIPHEDQMRVIAKGWEGNESLGRRIDRSFYLNRLTPGTHKQKMDAYERKLKLEQEGQR